MGLHLPTCPNLLYRQADHAVLPRSGTLDGHYGQATDRPARLGEGGRSSLVILDRGNRAAGSPADTERLAAGRGGQSLQSLVFTSPY